MNAVACMSCASEDVSAVILTDAARRAALRRCHRCGLVFREGWNSSFDAALYGYHANRAGEGREHVFDALNSARQQELLRDLERVVRGRRLLDLGCGYGHMVHSAGERGWDARGIDLAASAIEVCRRFGLRCDVLDFFSPELDQERFDVIVMSEFIEHVPQPGTFIRRAEQLLADSGVLYLTTPNFDSISRRALRDRWRVVHPEHLGYFTPRTLRHLVRSQTTLVELSLTSRNIDVASLLGALRTTLRKDGVGAPPRRLARGQGPSLRSAAARYRVVGHAKNLVNRALGLASLGDTIVAHYQRRT